MPHKPDNEQTVVVPIGRARQKHQKRIGEPTELEISERLVARFSGELRYCGTLGGWHAWTGTHWRLDERERARECAKEIARETAVEAAKLLDDDLFRAAKRAGSARGVSAILDLARSDPSIVFSPDDANRDPWALNCANGAIDLRTGALRGHDRSALITRCCSATFDPTAEAPRFHKFLEEIQPNADVRAYLQRFFGYASIAIVREHVLGVLWGPGANGKSVLADVVTHVLGDYSRPGPSSLIVGGAGHEPHPTDVASCVGSRLVVVHETRRGATMDSSKVKLLTGGDKLTTRFMREDFFDFSPSHTLLLLTNYRPTADASDAALWRRLQLVPFETIIPDGKRDPRLAESLRAEASGVLNWIVKGALEWQRIGLAPPKLVREQTDSYRASEDVIGQFLDECTVRLPEASIKAATLYAAYKGWCEQAGHRVARGNDFASELKGRGIASARRSSGVVYAGIGLRDPEAV